MPTNNATAIGNSRWASPVTRPAWQRYAASVLLMLVCGGIHLALQDAVGELSQVGLVYLAGILAVSTLLGLGPSLLAVALGTLLTAFLVPPAFTTRFDYPADVPVLALFAALGVTVTALSEWRRSAAAVVRTAVEVADHARRLEEEVRLRTELEEELRRSNASLQDFAHMIAHDLKEPLRGLSMTAQFLATDARGHLGPEDDVHLDRLTRLPQRLIQMLDALMEYARLGQRESAEARQADADLSVMARAVVETLGPWLERERASVVVPQGLPAVSCNPAIVGRVLTNLITNGIKYNTSEPKQVEITVRQPEDGRPMTVCVSDNGIGIPEAQRDKIFTMFRRLHRGEEFGGGTGAGLALTKRMVERHGGQIWAEEGPNGVGTVFCFTLEGATQRAGREAKGPTPTSEVPRRSAARQPQPLNV